MHKSVRDITNEKFGRLTVLFLTNKRSSQGDAVWHCRCDCGNEIDVSTSNLRTSNTKSCGCLKEEHGSNMGKLNEKDITGVRFGILTALEKTDKILGSSIIWKCKCDCGNTTLISQNNLSSGNTKSCGCLKEEHNANIGKENCVNGTNLTYIYKHETKANKNNRTGVRGVSLIANGIYRAGITFQKKRYHLGVFVNIEDASLAYEKAREKLYEDFLSWYNEQKLNDSKEK